VESTSTSLMTGSANAKSANSSENGNPCYTFLSKFVYRSALRMDIDSTPDRKIPDNKDKCAGVENLDRNCSHPQKSFTKLIVSTI